MGGQPYDRAVDLWSLGMLIHELVFDERMFTRRRGEKDTRRLYESIAYCDIDNELEKLKVGGRNCCNLSGSELGDVKNLLRILLNTDPQQRLGARARYTTQETYDELKRHPFFAGINWETLKTGEEESPFKKLITKYKPRWESLQRRNRLELTRKMKTSSLPVEAYKNFIDKYHPFEDFSHEQRFEGNEKVIIWGLTSKYSRYNGKNGTIIGYTPKEGKQKEDLYKLRIIDGKEKGVDVFVCNIFAKDTSKEQADIERDNDIFKKYNVPENQEDIQVTFCKKLKLSVAGLCGKGAIVEIVHEGSPAMEKEVCAGLIILRVNGEAVHDKLFTVICGKLKDLIQTKKEFTVTFGPRWRALTPEL